MPPLRNAGSPVRILIAQDERALAAVLKRPILRHDPDAVVALYENGCEALAAYDTDSADLIISNYFMPHMDDPTCSRTLRSRGGTTAIIGISGHAGNADAFRAAGATIFLDGVAFTPGLLAHVIALLLTLSDRS